MIWLSEQGPKQGSPWRDQREYYLPSHRAVQKNINRHQMEDLWNRWNVVIHICIVVGENKAEIIPLEDVFMYITFKSWGDVMKYRWSVWTVKSKNDSMYVKLRCNKSPRFLRCDLSLQYDWGGVRVTKYKTLCSLPKLLNCISFCMTHVTYHNDNVNVPLEK